MSSLGAWLREKPALLYWFIMALFLLNIFVLILDPPLPKLPLLVATFVVLFVLGYAQGREGRT